MRLSCPNCATEYEIPEAALAGRSRKLLCERCGHGWRSPEPGLTAPEGYTPTESFITAPQRYVPDGLGSPVLETPVFRASLLKAPYQPPADDSADIPAAPDAAIAAAPAGWLAKATLADPSDPSDPSESAPADGSLPHFGAPADAAAAAALREATLAEEAAPGPDSNAGASAYDRTSTLPAFLTSNTGNDTAAASAKAGPDRFADLVNAARNNEIELEPDRPRPPKGVRTSSTPFFIILVVLLLLGLIVLERHEVIRLIPAAAPIFKSWGFK